jgi:hypothetical protein
VVRDRWAIHNCLLTCVQFQEKHSSQRLVSLVVKLDLKGHGNILWGPEDPELLLLPVVNLTWLVLSLLL